MAKANKLAKESLSIKGTLVEYYLKEQRKIDLKIWPDDLRFHPNIYCAMNKKSTPAMLLLGRDKAGNIQVVQATFLDPITKNKLHKLPVSKQTIGIISGAAVHLSLPKDNKKSNELVTKSYLAEGAETGLSALMADPKNEVKVILGQSNFLSIDKLNLQKNVVFCFDHDAKSSPENRFKVQAERLQSEGKNVTYLKPKQVGHDLNDVLKEGGIERVKRVIRAQKTFGTHAEAKADFAKSIAKNIQNSRAAKANRFRQVTQEQARTPPIQSMSRQKGVERER